ncbi:MAG: M3 family oligoendopeptidase [Planctomycetota bacterium]
MTASRAHLDPDQPAYSSRNVRWNLTDLYRTIYDRRIEEDLTAVEKEAAQFAKRYRGKINVKGGPKPALLRKAIEEILLLQSKRVRFESFIYLSAAVDQLNNPINKMKARIEERMTQVSNATLFFDLEWKSLPAAVARKIARSPLLKEHRHWLENDLRLAPYKLSEPEEKVVNEKDNSATATLGRIFNELHAGLKYRPVIDGKEQSLTQPGVLALLKHPKREVRQAAFEAVGRTLDENKLVLAVNYDGLVHDYLTMVRLRGYKTPIARRHLANEIAPEAVDTMMKVVEKNYATAHRYWRLKKKLLKLDHFMLFDQYAPIGAALPKCDYTRSKEIVLDAFGQFSPRFRAGAQKFFDGNWIDAEVRPGKRGGAFCAGLAPEFHPYVMLNHTDELRDVMTMAHELGHGMHDLLAGEKQHYFHYHPPLTLAETASVFAEMLTFESLMQNAESDATRLTLVCQKIEDLFATAYRQNVLTRFELSVYAARAKGRLSGDDICEHWIAANLPYYKGSVEIPEAYRLMWSYIPHFIHTPFYCYAYVFGQLMVLALYAMYKEQGAAFVPKFETLLAAGGSEDPAQLLKKVDVDIASAAFWQKGMNEIDRMVKQAETLAK